jgi:hypothetical protein
MSLIAALQWRKSPKCCVATLIFDEENMKILSSPKINYLPKNYFRLKREVKKIIKDYFQQIQKLHHEYGKPIKLEFKIVFNVKNIPYIIPAKESKFVYKNFNYWIKKTQKRIKNLTVNPQLRKKLSGKSLKSFNKQLQSLHLVSRKKDTRYEYNLWAVALHATVSNYERKLKLVRKILLDSYERDDFLSETS